MSAFMCDKETIYDIATYIFSTMQYSLRQLFNTTINREELYKKLVDLNVAALDERYDEEVVSEMIEGGIESYYAAYYELIKSSFTAYNNFMRTEIRIRCYLYQCNEGNIDKDPLYKLVEDAHYKLCTHIVQEIEKTLIGSEELLYWR